MSECKNCGIIYKDTQAEQRSRDRLMLAGRAMQALIPIFCVIKEEENNIIYTPESVAEVAIKHADALLAELNKKETIE